MTQLLGHLSFYLFIYILYSSFFLVIYFIHISVYYVNPNLPIHPTTTPLHFPRVHTFVLYICVSISALQTGSSVPFF